MTKRKGIIFCVLVLAVGLICYIKMQYTPEHVEKMLDGRVAVYNQVAEFYYADYQKNQKEIMAYSFMSNNKVSCNLGQFKTREILLNEEEIAAFEEVYDSYLLDDKNVERVYVYDNFVALSNINGRESVVYSVDGTKPQWVNNSNDQFSRISVDKITENWYYVVGHESLF